MAYEMLSKQAILFYDGDCALCNRVVTLILNHERRPIIYFSALASEATKEWCAANPEFKMDEDMVYFYDGKELHSKSTAVLKLLPYLKVYCIVFRSGWLLPKAIRDGLYDFVAKRRKKIFKECLVDPRLAGRCLKQEIAQ